MPSKNYGGSNYTQANGIIQSLIDQGLTNRAIKGVLKSVGNRRIDRIRKNPVQSPRSGFIPHNAFSKDDKHRIRVFIMRLDTEEGFPCSHRAPRQYLVKEGATFKSCWRIYAMVMKLNGWRYASYNRFAEYWRHHFPGLKTTRLASDACDSCVRIQVALKDPLLNEEERKELLTQQSMHLDPAKAQRKAMNTAVMAAIRTWSPEEASNLRGIDYVPEVLDGNGEPCEDDNKLRNVVVQCEDFGQSIAMPHYGYQQPGLDYFNSNLMMHEFVVADRVTNTILVYFYDDRVLKKNGESMCNLRLIDHTQLAKRYLNASVPLPKVYIAVMDNCCGQNKSKSVFMVFQLLPLMFYDTVVLNFLLPGHSHMAADRVVSWVRTSLGKSNIYTPEQLFTKVNGIKNVTAVDVSKFKLYQGFEGILKKYFEPMPSGYTKYYYFEIANGRCRFKFHADSEDCFEFVFCRGDVAMTKRAILRELFGVDTVKDYIQNNDVCLPPFEKPVLSNSKIQSLGNKYSTIHSKYLWYYPNLDEEPGPGVAEDDVNADGDSLKRMRRRSLLVKSP